MPEDTRDTLMVIVDDGGPIDAEANSEIDNDDSMVPLEFFTGDFFAIEEFSIELDLSDESSESEPVTQAQLKEMQEQHAAMMKAAKSGGKAPEAAKKTKFSKFMTQGSAAMRQTGGAYPAELTPVSITKRMDKTSVKLFDLCKSCKLIKRAVIIKRRAIGKEYLQAYMMLEFFNLLITDLDWDDDAIIKETFKFVCREVRITYRQEKSSGKLDKILGPKGWKQPEPT